jgi:septal ring factor EnvC (AmiA/AmiB activator)
MKKSLLLATAVTFSFLSAACASNPAPMDAGERMSQRGDDIGAYGSSWSDGQKSVAQGQESVAKSTKSIAEAERDLARARADIAKAEQQIAERRSPAPHWPISAQESGTSPSFARC